MPASRSYWDRFAQAYASLGTPLRPSSEDLSFVAKSVNGWAAAHPSQPVRTLLLGVTPDIVQICWPLNCYLLAVDQSYSMIRSVWQGNVAGTRAAVCANWLALPLPESSCCVAVGDGSINHLVYPEGFRALLEALSKVLCEDGLLILRCYIPPDVRETPENVFAHARRGSIGSFHAFKLRLLMALQETPEDGVAVKEAYSIWESENSQAPLQPVDWPRADIETIQFYRDSITVYAFPALEELRRVLSPWFQEVSILTPSYEMGERCPTLVFRSWKGAVGS